MERPSRELDHYISDLMEKLIEHHHTIMGGERPSNITCTYEDGEELNPFDAMTAATLREVFTLRRPWLLEKLPENIFVRDTRPNSGGGGTLCPTSAPLASA